MLESEVFGYWAFGTGPDLDSWSPECSRTQSTGAPPTVSQGSYQDTEWEQDKEAASEKSDEPLVQSDEEDVQPDMLLANFHDICARRASDAGDLPSG